MSKEYMVLLVEKTEDDDSLDIDGQPGEVFMRFTEPPSDDFLKRIAKSRPSHRVYCLVGASSWHPYDQ